MNFPLCREDQFNQLSKATKFHSRLIIVSGPVSSGKSTTVKLMLDQFKEKDDTECAHVFIDVGDSICDVLSEANDQIFHNKKRVRSFQSLEKAFAGNNSDKRVLIAFDSFDLLGENALTLFEQAEAIVDARLMQNFTFIFVTHVNPLSFTSHPLSFINILFPQYTKEEIEQIVSSIYSAKKEMPEMIKRVLQIVGPMTTDLRDIIFLAHTMSNYTKLTNDQLGRFALQCLNKMRAQKTSRINDIPTLASAILLGTFIASKTTITSDLMRFARTLKKKKKNVTLLERNEYIPMERVIALAKALLFSHLGEMDFDYAGFIQIQNLIDLELLGIRGDLYGEPKLICLATEQEIFAVAQKLNIRIDEYISEK